MGHFLFFLKRQIPLRVPMAGRCHVGQQAVAGCQRVQLQVLRNAAVMQDQCAVQKMLHILNIMGREQQRFAAGQGAVGQEPDHAASRSGNADG
mgnify:CR=1 FL=1